MGKYENWEGFGIKWIAKSGKNERANASIGDTLVWKRMKNVVAGWRACVR